MKKRSITRKRRVLIQQARMTEILTQRVVKDKKDKWAAQRGENYRWNLCVARLEGATRQLEICEKQDRLTRIGLEF